MNKLANSERMAILLAGGEGTRLGQVGRLLPKCLLPISTEETLLSRNVEQLVRAQVKEIVISASPGNFRMIQAFTQPLSRELRQQAVNLRVIKNAAHRSGPISALAAILNQNVRPAYLLALADIAFEQNAFTSLGGAATTQNVLAVSDREPGRGGIVIVRETHVLALHYRNDAIPLAKRGTYNWTGAACFSCRAARVIAVCAASAETPLEFAFSSLLSNSETLRIIKVPKFVNVNNFADLDRARVMVHSTSRSRRSLEKFPASASVGG